MEAADRRRSLLDVLGSVPDLRSRYGRRYPIGSLLAVLTLPAMNGQSSLRGMWPWAGAHLVFLLCSARNASFPKDRLPGREVTLGLSTRGSLALNLIRALGYPFVVDAFRTLSARADRSLSLLSG